MMYMILDMGQDVIVCLVLNCCIFMYYYYFLGIMFVWLCSMCSLWVLSIIQQLDSHETDLLLLPLAGHACVYNYDTAWHGDSAS